MMMEVVYFAVAALSLPSVGQSAPVTSCETLIQPLVIPGRDQLLGKWIFVAESVTIPGARLLTDLLAGSAWSKMTSANESDAIDLVQVQSTIDRCYSLRTKLTLQNSTLYMEHPYPAVVTLLNTGCSDCLVLYSRFTLGSAFSGLQLLSRRRGVSVDEKQEFLKQVECLNLPSPAFLDPEKGLCPDDSLPLGSETIDMTNAIDDLKSEWSSMLGNITSVIGLDTLLKLFSK